MDLRVSLGVMTNANSYDVRITNELKGVVTAYGHMMGAEYPGLNE